MSVKFAGVSAEMKRIKAEIKDHTKIIKQKASIGIQAGARAAMAATPVFSGAAVRNYHLGVGTVPTRQVTPVGGHIPWPARDGIPEDAKNERRRGANEAAALGAISGKLAGFVAMKKLPKMLVLKNTSDIAGLIDSGSAPTASRSRYSGGVGILMQQTVRSASGGTLK